MPEGCAKAFLIRSFAQTESGGLAAAKGHGNLQLRSWLCLERRLSRTAAVRLTNRLGHLPCEILPLPQDDGFEPFEFHFDATLNISAETESKRLGPHLRGLQQLGRKGYASVQVVAAFRNSHAVRTADHKAVCDNEIRNRPLNGPAQVPSSLSVVQVPDLPAETVRRGCVVGRYKKAGVPEGTPACGTTISSRERAGSRRRPDTRPCCRYPDWRRR
jgi:hypothetical protein